MHDDSNKDDEKIKRYRIHIINIICTVCYKFSSKLRFPLLSIIIMHYIHIVCTIAFLYFIRYMHVCQNLLIIEESIYVLLLSMALLFRWHFFFLCLASFINYIWIIDLWIVYGPWKNIIYMGMDGLQLFTCLTFYLHNFSWSLLAIARAFSIIIITYTIPCRQIFNDARALVNLIMHISFSFNKVFFNSFLWFLFEFFFQNKLLNL